VSIDLSFDSITIWMKLWVERGNDPK